MGGGQSGQTQSSPSPSIPGTAHFGVKAAQIPISGSPTVPADPVLGFFLPRSGSRRLLWRGQGRRGLQKTPTRPSPNTHPVSTNWFFGGKSGRIGQTALFRTGFGGDLGSGGARMPRPGGVPALPPPPDAPNRPESPQIRRPSPPYPSPSAGPGGRGAQGGGGARPVPATADFGGEGGGLASILRLPPLSLAPTLTRFGDKSLNLTNPAAGFGEKT